MFNPFNKTDKNPYQMNSPYTVGITEDGRTVLRINDRDGTTSLYLSKDATRQMIRLLEATITETKE